MLLKGSQQDTKRKVFQSQKLEKELLTMRLVMLLLDGSSKEEIL
jgi:hypothetical protein